MTRTLLSCVMTVGCVIACAVRPLSAVTTEFWQEHQPEEFEKGKCEGAVISSLGRLLLGRSEEELVKATDEAEFVNALAQAPHGAIYAATGPNAIVYRVADGKSDVFCRIPAEGNLFSLLIAADGNLLVGTGGTVGRIYRVGPTGQMTLWYDPEKTPPTPRPATRKADEAGAQTKATTSAARERVSTKPTTSAASSPATTTAATSSTAPACPISYIWAMARGAAGEVYAATGPEGMLIEIDRDGKTAKVLFDSKETNLLSLAVGAEGQLYTGSDKKGLIYRVEPRTGKTVVLYDTGEADVSAIAVDAAGNVFAATAAPSAARPGRSAKPKPQGQPGSAPTSAPAAVPKAGAPRVIRSVGQPVPVPGGMGGAPAEGKSTGNAVYRVAPDGMVTEVFREPVMILCLVEADGVLYLGTGSEGRVYMVRPEQEEQIALAKVKDSQVTSILRSNDGRVHLGTSNKGRVLRLSPGYAPKGTFTSQVLDARQIARWGRAFYEGDAPQGTGVRLSTRSGNVADPEEGTWTAWSEEFDARQGAQIPSPSARFLQYRVILTSTEAKQTPVVRQLRLARQVNNIAPKVAALEIGPPLRAQMAATMGGAQNPDGEGQRPLPPGATPSTRIIRWKAQDANGDQMVYDLYFRQLGRKNWILIKDDIKTPEFKWETSKVGDGQYEVRVMAKDSPSNPPATALATDRISDMVIIDNTPPEVTELKAERLAKGKYRVHAVLVDKFATVAGAHYAVDSDEDWISIPAEDDLFDSLREPISFVIDNLKPGEHVVTIRARDDQENRGFATVVVAVEE